MVLGETGRFPLSIAIKTRMISFWCKLITSDVNRFSTTQYNLLQIYNVNNIFTSNWLQYIKTILDETGFSYIWTLQEVPNINTFPNQIKQRLQDQYIQQWSADLSLSNKCRENLSSKNIYAPCHLLTEFFFVDLEHQTIDYQLKGEDTMASIEKTEHVHFVILIKFVMNSTLYSNVIPLLIYGKLSYRPTVKIILTI